MKTTLTTYDIADALFSDEFGGWSRAGAFALAEWLEEMEDSTGEETELDVVAIRCDFSEHESLIAWADDYFCDWRKDLDVDLNESIDDPAFCDECEETIREHIQDNGFLIEFEGGIIVSSS